MIAFITVDSIMRQDPGFIKFHDKSQKVWNCNKPELFTDDAGQLAWGPGTRLKIDYNETTPQPGRRPSKYINNARPARPDEANTWPDKEPYQGGQFSSGGAVKKSDFDPEVSKRQTAANVAGSIIANARQGGGLTMDDLDEIATIFKTVADMVVGWVNESPKSVAGGAGGEGDDGFGSETIDF